MIKNQSEEYLRESEPDRIEKRYVWETSIGMQEVDELKTSDYLREMAERHIEGKVTIEEARELLDRYYLERSVREVGERTEEADKVSLRMVKLLLERAFRFTIQEFLSIHQRLFVGLYEFAGKLRDYNITKEEWVLDGATVFYASATELRATLEYDLAEEKKFRYQGLSMEEIIRHLAEFVARLWQIHPFSEGNTRTTVVFFIKYLRSLGFEVTNDTFAQNARYFRNALVRANYNDLRNGVHETTSYLELFLKNLLLGEKNELKNRVLHIRAKRNG